MKILKREIRTELSAEQVANALREDCLPFYTRPHGKKYRFHGRVRENSFFLYYTEKGRNNMIFAKGDIIPFGSSSLVTFEVHLSWFAVFFWLFMILSFILFRTPKHIIMAFAVGASVVAVTCLMAKNTANAITEKIKEEERRLSDI